MGPIARLMRWPVRRLGRTVLGWMTATEVEGFVVCAEGDFAEVEPFASIIGEALALVRTHDPRRFARARGDVWRVVVLDSREGGAYWSSVDVIAVGAGSLNAGSPVSLACMMVHEATHARLHRWGLRSTVRSRPRIERRCVEESHRFLGRLPAEHAAEVERIVAHQQACLESPEPWYGPSGRRAKRRRVLEERNRPRWLVWLLTRRSPWSRP